MVCHNLKVKRALDMTTPYDTAIMFKIFMNRKHHQDASVWTFIEKQKIINEMLRLKRNQVRNYE